MPNTVLGKVSVTPKGAWSGSSSYEKLDIVSNGGNSYIALQNVPSGTALSNSSYWLMIAQKGDKGNTGEITGASASISGGYGTPSVSVTNGGTSTDRSFAFAFSNLKGNGISAVNCEKTGTSGAVDTYTLTISEDDGTVNTFALEVTNGSVTSVNGRTGAVTGLAEDNGYYEDMTVGGAEQLISSTYVEDSVPYVFRTSGGSADIGDREVDEIHGGTIAWNQLVVTSPTSSTANGITFTNNGDGSWTVNGTATDRATKYLVIANPGNKSGHKMLLIGCPSGGGDSTYRVLDASGNSGNVVDSGNGTVYNVTATNGNYSCAIVVFSGVTVNNLVFKPQLFDLTQMFGTTIADYIYSLEQANAGAGVAWFKSLFQNPYYPYNAGELISVSGLSAHKMTGFNQFDVDNANLSQGNFDNETSGVATNVVTRNYTKVVGGATYAWSQNTFNDGGARYVRFYDADENFITGNNLYGNGIKTFTTPTNACYAKFMWFKESNVSIAQVQNGNVCIHLQWDGERNGEFEPFESHEYALDSDVTLRGIPKLDADNKLYYDGDVYEADGTVQRRYGIVDLGSLTYTKNTNPSNTPYYQTTGLSSVIARPSINSELPNMISAKFPEAPVNVGWGGSAVEVITCNTSGHVTIYTNGNYADASAFKTAMNGVYLVYPLATPTTESAEPYTSPQIVSDWGTEEYVIAEQSGVAIPVGHETKYTANLKAKLEMAPNSPSGDGDYIVRQTGGINTYVPLTERIPNAPSENGNYILKCTVNGSTVTYTWESAT